MMLESEQRKPESMPRWRSLHPWQSSVGDFYYLCNNVELTSNLLAAKTCFLNKISSIEDDVNELGYQFRTFL